MRYYNVLLPCAIRKTKFMWNIVAIYSFNSVNSNGRIEEKIEIRNLNDLMVNDH